MQKILTGALGVVAGLAIAGAAYFVSHRQRPVPHVPQELDLSKAKPAFAVRSFGGTLLGFDVGEWGGSLSFRDAKGNLREVVPDNVRAIIPRGPDVLVFTGLAHLGENHGAIYLLRPDATRQFTVTQLHALDGAPGVIEPNAAAGTVDFNVFSGMDDRRGGWIYLCRRLTQDLQLEAMAACKVRDPDDSRRPALRVRYWPIADPLVRRVRRQYAVAHIVSIRVFVVMEASSPLEAKFSLTFQERVRAGWALTLGSPASLAWLSFFPLCGIILLSLMVLPSSRSSTWDALVAALCFGFAPFMFFLNTYRAHRADRKNGPYTYRFDQAGLQVRSSTSELKQSWAAIPRTRESLGILFLYFNKQCAHCIPVRAFSSSAVAGSVMQLAAASGVPRVGT